MASLLPATIINAKKESVPSSSLAGKVVGLYFSAHWCPPCRGFTPKLVEWFENFKSKHPQKDQLELVFVSSDRDQASFDEYHHEMNFHALPYSDRETKTQLSKKFGVRGIPTLIFLDADGNIISKNGRELVSDDPQGAEFPWTPKPFAEILGDSFVNNKGDKFTRADLAGKYLGLYFSAHWCPPCRGFTPKLVATYNKLKADGKNFEVVFVSADNSKEEFEEYFGSMPWLALDQDADSRKRGLNRHFEIEGIPSLIILDPDFKVITAEGTGAVGGDPEGDDFPWLPKPLNPMNDSAGSIINDSAFLLANVDGSDDEVKAAIAALQPAADAEFAKPERKLHFFYVRDPEEDIVEAVVKYTKLTDAQKLVIIDVQGNKKFVAADQSLTADNVNAFVSAYLAGSLSAAPIRND